jgi:hypothetical protein
MYIQPSSIQLDFLFRNRTCSGLRAAGRRGGAGEPQAFARRVRWNCGRLLKLYARGGKRLKLKFPKK